MKSSESSSVKQSKHKLIYFLIISSFTGLLSSSYLLINLVTGVSQSCTPSQACYFDTDKYSTIFSSKIMVLPTLYFLIALVLVLYFFATENKRLGKILYYFTECALLVVALFVYIEIYKTEGICPICLVIIAVSLMLFVSGLYLPKHFRQL